jgi:endonuclease YncB( thermonuclease family)
MSYNAIVRAKQNRVWASRPTNLEPLLGSTDGRKYHGWEVGSSQASRIGIPARLVRNISERTNTLRVTDGKIVNNDKNLVVVQNTLSGVGRFRSQYNVDADGIKSARYYLDADPRYVINFKLLITPGPLFVGNFKYGYIYSKKSLVLTTLSVNLGIPEDNIILRFYTGSVKADVTIPFSENSEDKIKGIDYIDAFSQALDNDVNAIPYDFQKCKMSITQEHYFNMLAFASQGQLDTPQEFNINSNRFYKIIDGDTVWIDDYPIRRLWRDTYGGNLPDRVSLRLLCIDAPEIATQNSPAEPFADESRQKLVDLLGEVGSYTVTIVRFDSFQRAIGNITPPGTTETVSDTLVKNGLAVVRCGVRCRRRDLCDIPAFDLLQDDAKSNILGIWSLS